MPNLNNTKNPVINASGQPSPVMNLVRREERGQA